MRARGGEEGAGIMAQSGEARALDMRSAGTQGAREPSMEEILASIKRIIEDTDSVRRPGATETEAVVVEAPVVESPAADNDTAEVSAFRSGLDNDAPAPRAPEERVLGPYAALTAEPFRAAPAVESFRSPPPVPTEPVAARPAVTAPAPEQPIGAQALAPRPSIISDHAGRQVAAAFGELSDAFAASRKRSFDEIAEEMMRPMLQDWLDNNLPLLVERLVREEIERVARGGVR
jgi:cell pole-organizing protein PopZ